MDSPAGSARVLRPLDTAKSRPPVLAALFQTGAEVVSETFYYRFAGELVAIRVDGDLSYVVGDHLGSTSVVYNPATGDVAQRWYEPFGQVRHATGVVPTDVGYTGQRADAESGLMFYNARYYDPAVGRFISPDTIVPNPGNSQDLNRFVYVRNKPINYNDPSGHDPCPDGSGGTICDPGGNVVWPVPGADPNPIGAVDVTVDFVFTGVAEFGNEVTTVVPVEIRSARGSDKYVLTLPDGSREWISASDFDPDNLIQLRREGANGILRNVDPALVRRLGNFASRGIGTTEAVFAFAAIREAFVQAGAQAAVPVAVEGTAAAAAGAYGYYLGTLAVARFAAQTPHLGGRVLAGGAVAILSTEGGRRTTEAFYRSGGPTRVSSTGYLFHLGGGLPNLSDLRSIFP